MTSESMIPREILSYLSYLKDKYPVISITGPRQSGKTTLAKFFFHDKPYVNLEDLEKREQANSDPKKFLRQFENTGAIIDEAQYAPNLFSFIQVLVDEKKQNAMFILTGSQQFLMDNHISQSLSGRVGLVTLLPLSLAELNQTKEYNSKKLSFDQLLFLGSYPGVYEKKTNPNIFYRDYERTYIERDLKEITNIQNLSLFRKFLKLCAARIGQVLNYDNLASDLGISAKTVKEWISILEVSYIVFILQPYFANIKKRLIKAPKLYFYDLGLVSYLLGIESVNQITTHSSRGSLFENLTVIEALKFRYNQGRDNNLYFYRDKAKEVDLLFTNAANFLPIEIKSSETISQSLFDNLIYLDKIFKGQDLMPWGKLLVYSGNEEQDWKAAKVINPWSLSSNLEKISKPVADIF